MNEKNEFNQDVSFSINDWQPPKKPPRTNLVGRYSILEPADAKKHSQTLYATLTNHNTHEFWTYLPFGPFATHKEFQEWFETTLQKPDNLLYTIFNNQTQIPLGTLGYMRVTPEHGVLEIGHVLFSKQLKQTTAATEAVYLLLEQAFDVLHYRRCEWKCNALNQASRLAAIRFGFTFEGVFRQHFVYKNRNRDTAWFSIIDSEWPAIKNKFKKWLHPKNFDHEGKQLIKLKDF